MDGIHPQLVVSERSTTGHAVQGTCAHQSHVMMPVTAAGVGGVGGVNAV